ncbi:hypothetical protein HDZ31DRAFT_84528 [Schizophyllum fasciatum]
MPGLALSSTPSATSAPFTVTKRPICESPTPFPSAPAIELSRPEYPFWIATYGDLPLELQAFLADNGIYDFTPESYDAEDVDAARVFLTEELYRNVREALARGNQDLDQLQLGLQQILDAHMLRFDALLCCEVVVREELGEQVADDAVEMMRDYEMDDKIGFILSTLGGGSPDERSDKFSL